MIEPLEISVDLNCSAQHAFRTWTEDFTRWWPPGHTISDNPELVVFEARVGGRIFERRRDGTEIEWGEVTTYDPPTRLRYLWHIGRAASDATDVELRFTDLSGSRCRLEIVHTGWERLGGDAQGFRDANQGGWNRLLPSYLDAIEPTKP